MVCIQILSLSFQKFHNFRQVLSSEDLLAWHFLDPLSVTPKPLSPADTLNWGLSEQRTRDMKGWWEDSRLHALYLVVTQGYVCP